MSDDGSIETALAVLATKVEAMMERISKLEEGHQYMTRLAITTLITLLVAIALAAFNLAKLPNFLQIQNFPIDFTI